MTGGRNARYKARVSFLGEVPIEIMPTLTTDPESWENTIRATYSAADKIEIWEVDAYGNAVSTAAEAAEEREEPQRPAETTPAGSEGEEKPAKRPPGMGSLFK